MSEVYINMPKSKIDALSKNYEKAKILDELFALLESIFPEELKKVYRKYPKLPAIIDLVRASKAPISESDIDTLMVSVDEILKSESMISLQDELGYAAKEIFQTLFPETNIEKWVKFQTGQEKLDGYQDILLAPAKGIERIVGGLIELFNPKTYGELAAATRYMKGISFKDFCEIAKITQRQFQELDSTKQASIAIELVYSIVLVFGGISKVSSLLGKYTTLSKILSAGPGGLENLKVLSRILTLNTALLSIRKIR